MALTQTDLDQLDAAIATGTLTVELAGRRITYRSVDELLAARAHVASVLAHAGTDAVGTRKSGSTYRYTFLTARGE
jgi:hypothetical protein